MQSWQKRGAWKALAFGALAVVAFASPAEAQVVSSTTVTAIPSTAVTGQPVALDAVVTCDGDPSGALGMTFFDGATLLATVPVAVNGTAILPTSFATTGAHTITAAYNGNANCDASSGTTTVEVTAGPTPPPPGVCLLACGSLINLDFEDIYNTYDVDIHNTNSFNNTHNTHNTDSFNNVHNVADGGGHRPWNSGSDWGPKQH